LAVAVALAREPEELRDPDAPRGADVFDGETGGFPAGLPVDGLREAMCGTSLRGRKSGHDSA
jgi:hypothetical protein